MEVWLRFILAFVIFCHGFIYVRIGSVLPGPIIGWTGRSWLLGDHVGEGRLLTTFAIPLHVLAGITFLTCAVAIAFAPSLSGLWRPLAIAGGLLGIAGFLVFWDGQTQLLAQEGLIGAVISAVIILCAIIITR
jgi:hypothetical protein